MLLIIRLQFLKIFVVFTELYRCSKVFKIGSYWFDPQDRKLGAVLTRAFDDCLVSESIFKLLHIFGSLIQRKLIAQELSARMPILVTMLNQEMDESKVIYNKQIQRYYLKIEAFLIDDFCILKQLGA